MSLKMYTESWQNLIRKKRKKLNQIVDMYVCVGRYCKKYYSIESPMEYIVLPPKYDYCELITVAFNNAEFIKYQIKALQLHFSYPFRYTVFDNSTNNDTSQQIIALCKENSCCYVKVPTQKKMEVSLSHGIALTWAWKNYIIASNAKYYGILDHDIFPVAIFDIEKYIQNQPIYGLGKNQEEIPLNLTENRRRWFLWPGFSFYRMDLIRGKQLDFRPDYLLGLDTGGKNYKRIYKKLDIKTLHFASVVYKKMDTTLSAFSGGYEEYDCGWIHMWNGSGYAGEDKALWIIKRANFMKKLNEYIKF